MINVKTLNFKTDFLQGPILRSLLIFAFPILLSTLFQNLYNMADVMIVGMYLGDNALAAMGACTSVYELLVGFALGVGNGLAVVTARCFGGGNRTLLKKAVAHSLVIGGITTAVITLGGSRVLMPLLSLLNTPPEIIGESYSYISVIVLFTAVMFAYNLLSGLLRSVGDSFMPLIFLIISSLLNIFLDILFIAKFGMGVAGAAYATVIAQGISALFCFVYIIRQVYLLVPSKSDFRLDKPLWNELWGQSLSMGLMGSIVSAGSVILQAGINGFGTAIIAGHTAARKIYMFLSMPTGAFSHAMATFVSQNYGAGSRDRIIKGVRYGYGVYLAVAVAATALMQFGARDLVAFVSGSAEAVVLDNASLYLRITTPFFMVIGVLLQTRVCLQGIGSKIMPLISSIIEFAGKILFCAFIIPRFGYIAVILCEPIIWIFMTSQLLWSFYTHPFIKNK